MQWFWKRTLLNLWWVDLWPSISTLDARICGAISITSLIWHIHSPHNIYIYSYAWWYYCSLMVSCYGFLHNVKCCVLGTLAHVVLSPCQISCPHDDVITWKHFQRHWPFVRGIHRQWPVTRSFDVFFDMRLNKRFSAGHLISHLTHNDVTVM